MNDDDQHVMYVHIPDLLCILDYMNDQLHMRRIVELVLAFVHTHEQINTCYEHNVLITARVQFEYAYFMFLSNTILKRTGKKMPREYHMSSQIR